MQVNERKSVLVPQPSFCSTRGSDRPPHLKPTKVTLFTMILYNSENSIREVFELCHCSRYKAILSSIVLSQRYSSILSALLQ